VIPSLSIDPSITVSAWNPLTLLNETFARNVFSTEAISHSGENTLSQHSIYGRFARVHSLVMAPAEGAVTMTLHGQVDVLSGSVFGQTGLDIPITTTLTLNNSAASTILSPSDWAAESLYGYQFTGVTGVGVTFGSKMWDTAALDLLTPKAGFEGDIWFNVNLASGTPTIAWMQFSEGEGSIQFGSLTTNPDLALQSTISVVDYSGGGFGNTSIGFFSDITIPEPSTVILLSGSLLLLLTTRTRKPA
jgi:hypothetical protein